MNLDIINEKDGTINLQIENNTFLEIKSPQSIYVTMFDRVVYIDFSTDDLIISSFENKNY